MKKRLLYIGNKLSGNKKTVTTIETLSALLKEEGYEVVSASSVSNKILRLLDMLWQTFKYRNKVDFVLIDTYSTLNFYYAVYVAKICRFYKIPYIPILHGGNLPRRLKKSPKQSKKIFANAKINIAPSHYLKEAFIKEGFTNITYIPNTIELKNYPFLLRKEIKVKLLWVRSFAKLYNPKLALAIVEALQKQKIEVSLCMVGPEKDGTLAECKKIVTEKNLPITFTGKRSKEEWISLSKDYDLFINTTNFDNTPVSVIEAMALGLPVISTNVGGIPFSIQHNKTGILVEPNNVSHFVRAINDLVKSSDKAQKIAAQARKKVEQFDWEIVKHDWNHILQK